MIYEFLKKEISQNNMKLNDNLVNEQEYKLWKESTLTKMDLFLLRNRITNVQYEDLLKLFI